MGNVYIYKRVRGKLEGSRVEKEGVQEAAGKWEERIPSKWCLI